ncbi:MAG: hypothetical protein EPO07_07850 [Verrucomicrobia bacterium]|nr:MAG: hypothetical protein EPO07_07850 [Verrucomicrobiota bacterium]
MKTLILPAIFALMFSVTSCSHQPTIQAAPKPASVSALETSPAPPPTSPASVPPTANVAGEWHWVCCEGRYQGELKLEQDAANKLTGRLYDENDTTGGAVEGSISGSKVQFNRTWAEDSRQEYALTLSGDGKKLEGELEGTRDESVGSHFEATRK